MNNLISFTISILFLLISFATLGQHKQNYDLRVEHWNKFSDANYQEKFLWGNEEEGIILREYSLMDEQSLVFIEGLYEGKPKGVTLMMERDGGSWNLKIMDIKALEKDSINYVTRGHHNLMIIGSKAIGKKEHFHMKYLEDSPYNPFKLGNAIYINNQKKKFYLKSCYESPETKKEYCHPRAEYIEKGSFSGIVWDEEGNGDYRPLMGRSVNAKGEVLYGLSHNDNSDYRKKLNVTKQNDGTITIGMTDADGLPFDSYVVVKNSDKIFFAHESYIMFLTDYNEVEISKYIK